MPSPPRRAIRGQNCSDAVRVLAFDVVYFARWLLIALVLIGSAANALAPNEKVTLRLELDSPKAARGGQTGLKILPEVERGWHINAHKPTETLPHSD